MNTETLMNTEPQYTLSVLTEDRAGLLNNITLIFSRRKINLSSLNVSSTEVPGISRFTIVAECTRDRADKVCAQIRKLVDVAGAFVYEDHEIYYQEIALYKIPTAAVLNGQTLENIVRNNGARILSVEAHHIVIEKTGHKEETHALYELLEPFGLLEFVRSGRVAVSKSLRRTEAYIKELEESNSNTLSIKNY